MNNTKAVLPAYGLCSEAGGLRPSFTWSQVRKKMAPHLQAASFFKKTNLITLKSNRKKKSQARKKKKKTLNSILVCELVSVSVHPVLRREGHFIKVAAITAAFTWLDQHGQPLKPLTIRARKGHRHGAGVTWRAAPSIRTHAAVVGPVEADAHTFPIGQVDWLCDFLSWGAAFPFLWSSYESREIRVITWVIMIIISWNQDKWINK